MSLQLIDLKRDNSKVLDSFISDVLIQTNENLYARTTAQGGTVAENAFAVAGNNVMLNFGFIPEAGVKVKLVPKIRTIIDGSEFQRGWDFSFEIISMQFYSLFQIEKFKNQLCTINLHPLNLYLKDVYPQIEVDDAFDKEGNNKIILSGKKFVKEIRDVYDPNPWGDIDFVGSPWAKAATDFVAPAMPANVHASTPVGVYDIVSSRFESYKTSLIGTSGYGVGLEQL